MSENMLSSIESALEDLAKGKMVIVVDDENRENEGDLVAVAETITAESINFMVTHARGLICAPLPDDRCDALGLHQMVPKNTDPHQTAFTISVDLRGGGVTTGISAADRAATLRALVDESKQPADFSRPGHVFPLRARPGGVLRRAGHTASAIDLARLAGKSPAGVIVEILNPDGSMARLPELIAMGQKHDLKIISIEQLIAYRMKRESLIVLLDSFPYQSADGDFTAHVFKQTTSNQVHVAFTMGSWSEDDDVLVRVQSGDPRRSIMDEMAPDYQQRSTYHKAMKTIAEAGRGVLACLNQRPEDPSLLDAIVHYNDNKQPLTGMSKDPLDYGVGAQILHHLAVHRIILMTNHPMKRIGIEGYDLNIVGNHAFSTKA